MEDTSKPARKSRATTTAAKTAARATPAKTPARGGAATPAATKAKAAKPAKPAKPAAAAVQTPEERERMVRIAAYFRAERRGFAPGNEWDDWLAAEAEVGSLPAQNGTPRPRKTPARKKAAG